MSTLFSSLTLRSITFRNRIFVSPMCQYCSDQGLPTDWHLVHLGSRAVGGAGLVMVEATAVSPEGRITPDDSGIWSDAHAEAFTPITRFIREQGAVPGIQLAHVGRKGSCSLPWLGGNPLGPEACGWQTLGSSAVPFAVGHPAPHAISLAEMDEIEAQFRAEAEIAWARGRLHHRARPGRTDSRDRPSRCRAAGTADASRSLLAAACRQGLAC